jgi:CubicO group peptidase (beta-lactamase class C family)
MIRRAAFLLFSWAAAFAALGQSTDNLARMKDAPGATAAGTTFTQPAGWSMQSKDNVVVLEAPEGDSKLAIVDVDAADSAAAAQAAWKAYRPAAPWPLKTSNKQAPRNGWEERHLLLYETSPNERKTVYAWTLRKGAAWTVVIVDASDMTLEKRGSQVRLVTGSARPKGYTRETFAGKAAHPLDAQRIETLKGFIADGMKQLGVPGVGLAFLEGGKVVWEGGIGVKELGKPDRVDAHTLFIAASNTKGLTTLLISELVDEKKLRWDDKVVDVYPSFKLGDAATTRQVLVKHLICACTGMPRQDLEWIFEFKDATPASNMRLLGTMQPTSGFGQLFQYSNLMASAAGFIAGALVEPRMELGAAYDEAMRRKVFAPLGMNDTTFDFKRALSRNHASPHSDTVDGVPVVAKMDLNYAVVPARPAGGVWTSAHDLALYVQMELAKGKLPTGRRLVSEENLLARREPQVAVSEDIWYGMGLFNDKQYGIQILRHGGDLAGYHSDMIWLPDHGVGAVILTNHDNGPPLRGLLLRKMLEVMFDGAPEADAQLTAVVAQIRANQKKDRERLVIPAGRAAAGELAAHYRNADLGEIKVRRSGSAVWFDFGEWKSEMASRKNDDGTTSFITIEPTVQGFDFVVTGKSGKKGLVIRDAQHEYVFVET